jgi:hypothetical protein
MCKRVYIKVNNHIKWLRIISWLHMNIILKKNQDYQEFHRVYQDLHKDLILNYLKRQFVKYLNKDLNGLK